MKEKETKRRVLRNISRFPTPGLSRRQQPSRRTQPGPTEATSSKRKGGGRRRKLINPVLFPAQNSSTILPFPFTIDGIYTGSEQLPSPVIPAYRHRAVLPSISSTSVGRQNTHSLRTSIKRNVIPAIYAGGRHWNERNDLAYWHQTHDEDLVQLAHTSYAHVRVTGVTRWEREQSEAELLPPPPEVMYWIEGFGFKYPQGHEHAGEKAVEEATKAVDWLVEAVAASPAGPGNAETPRVLHKFMRCWYKSVKIQQKGRDLMASFQFTRNLANIELWHEVLMFKLTERAQAIAQELDETNRKILLKEELGLEAISMLFSIHPDYAHSTPEHSSALAATSTVDDMFAVLPALSKRWPYGASVAAAETPKSKHKESRSTSLYNVVVRQDQISQVLGLDEEGKTDELCLHTAPNKSMLRMINKLNNKHDHRRSVKPRPALNLDIVRRLLSTKTTKSARGAIASLSSGFNGFTKIKCLPDFVGSEEAAKRFHYLPVNMTVLFTPGVTIGELAEMPATQAIWADIASKRPGWSVSLEQWQVDHERARVVLLSDRCKNEQVAMHCEVQCVLEEVESMRTKGHEIYKCLRASTGFELHADCALPSVEPPTQNLIEASTAGRITTVRRLLSEGAVVVGSSGSGGNGGGSDKNSSGDGNSGGVDSAEEGGTVAGVNVDVNSTVEGGGDGSSSGGEGDAIVADTIERLPVDVNMVSKDGTGKTAMYWATANAHLDCIQELIARGADVNQLRIDTGANYLYWPSSDGHVDVVKLLLENGCNPSQGRSKDNRTPLFMAAEKGHEDIVTALLDAGALVNVQTTDNGQTPLYRAVQREQIDVVLPLLSRNADPNICRTDDGTTPLHVACYLGNLRLVAMLLDNGADPKTDSKWGDAELQARNGKRSEEDIAKDIVALLKGGKK